MEIITVKKDGDNTGNDPSVKIWGWRSLGKEREQSEQRSCGRRALGTFQELGAKV